MAAARNLYPEQGPDVSPESIERAARTGPGAFTRHFAEPADLAFAVFEQNMAAIEIFAARPENSVDDMLALIGEQLTSVMELLRILDVAGRDAERILVISNRLNTILTRKVAEGHRAGTVDPGFSATTVIMGIVLLAVALIRSEGNNDRSAATVASAMATLRRRVHPPTEQADDPASNRPAAPVNSIARPSSPTNETYRRP